MALVRAQGLQQLYSQKSFHIKHLRASNTPSTVHPHPWHGLCKVMGTGIAGCPVFQPSTPKDLP
ncbi:MAG: hypothetical protein CFE38_17750 [Comamonadaceae bacterium PBBC1]|nr:MAG: hypothetical protein CFE38_17750 [Comamonadaceae bacterium PBBC1]